MKRNFAFVPAFLFVTVAACFFTFQITYRKIDGLWKSSVDKMIRTDTTRINENLSSAQSAVSGDYLYSLNENNVVDGIMNGYINGIGDKYAMYLNKKQYEDYVKVTSNSSTLGIGVSLLYDSTLDGAYVVNVEKNSSAAASGLVPGDIVTHVNGSSVKNNGFYSSVIELVTGKENESVAVTVKRKNGESFSTFVEKKTVLTKNIMSEKLGNGIGLISVSGFDAEGKGNFVSEMQTLIAAGCDKFVIDVRNNAGGNLDAATSILDFLLPSGTIVTVTDKSGVTNTVNSDVNESHYPVAVLINKGTLGEAEVFAAAMRNLGGAKLVGTNTYGKASKQSVFQLPDGGAVCFSTTIYSVSESESFDNVGVTPDISVKLDDDAEMSFTTLDKSEDAQLQEAIGYLKQQKVDKIIY